MLATVHRQSRSGNKSTVFRGKECHAARDFVSPAEAPDPELVRTYDRLFPAYVQARGALAPVWEALAGRGGNVRPTIEDGSPEATLASERSTA